MKVPTFIVKRRIQLVDLLRELNILGAAAEIGVAEGNFSRDLLAAGIPFLYLVDAWQHIPNVKGDGNSPQEWHDRNYGSAMEKIKPFENRYKVIRALSKYACVEIPTEHLSLLYLDGNHSYEGVWSDLVFWHRTVRTGGVIAGHDYLMKQYGVKKAVDEFANRYNYIVNLIPEEKTEDAGFYFIKQ